MHPHTKCREVRRWLFDQFGKWEVGQVMYRSWQGVYMGYPIPIPIFAYVLFYGGLSLAPQPLSTMSSLGQLHDRLCRAGQNMNAHSPRHAKFSHMKPTLSS